MTEADWANHQNQVLGMLIDGEATDEVDERGRPVLGDTVLLLLNASRDALTFQLPRIDRAGLWQEMVNTARPGSIRAVTTPAVRLSAHALVLLRHGPDADSS